VAGEVCVYCGKAVLTGSEKPEHPIPAALGSSLTVRTVCDPCNEARGKDVDQPFLKDALVRETRAMADQRDQRRGAKARRPSSPLLQGHTAEGDFVRFDHETGRPVMGSRILDLGEGTKQIRAGSREEADRLLERERRKAEAEGKKLELESEEHDQSRPTIKVEIAVYPEAWRREAAKIALGVASAAFPEEWRTSPDAELLREWLDGRDRTSEDGKAPPLVPQQIDMGIRLAPGNEHLIFFKSGQEGVTWLAVALFGSLWFGVPVDSSGRAVPEDAWRLDWRKPTKDGQTTRNRIFMDAAERVVREQNSDPPDPPGPAE
jgi:hypothetical protein